MLLFALLTMSARTQTSYAETKAVKIWDFEGNSHRINKVLVIGVSKEATISYKLQGITEKSHTWSVDNTDVCELEEDDEVGTFRHGK